MLLSAVGWGVSRLVSGRGNIATRLFRTLSLVLLTIYALLYVVICFNPYWVDKGAVRYIPWFERLFWALGFGNMGLLAIVPVTVLGFAAYAAFRPRHEE
jgi:hypothetical protein